MIERKWEMPGKTLVIELSSACGANCIMCPINDFPYKAKYMDNDLFIKCVDDAYEHGARYIDTCSMGDSLLDPQKESKFKYVKEKYPDMKIYASCTGMSAEPDFVAKYIDTLHISFYGATPETYRKVHRGKADFYKAKENVESILDRPREERPYVVLTYLMLPENELEYELWKKEWEPIADEVIVWKPHNWGGIYTSSFFSKNNFSEARSCGRPFTGGFNVWVNGDVTVCCFSWDERLVIGNMYEQSFEDIYYGEKRKRIVDVHKKGLFLGCNLPCEKCDQIFSREDALIYTNNNRVIGQSIVDEEYVVKFKNNE